MRVLLLVKDICGPSWTYMHLGSYTFLVHFVVPQVGAPFGHCISSIHSLVPVEY